jgi:hypothetical protein
MLYYFPKWKTPIYIILYPYIDTWDVLIFRMAASAFHQALGTLQSHGYLSNSGLRHELGDNSLRLFSKGFKVEIGLSRKGCYLSDQRKFGVVQASASQTSVFEPVLSPSKSNASSSQKKSSKPVILNQIFIHSQVVPFVESSNCCSVFSFR